MGDPADEQTFIGPMISVKEAERLHGWVLEAQAAGATVLAGGKREGAMLEATLLDNVTSDMTVNNQEAFGPVATLSKFSDFDKALEEVNNSDFGLQAGIFTKDIYKAHKAWEELEVGGVVIGDVPSWRVDHMPYGGVKDSGLGREGVRYAIEDMTELKLMVLRTPK
jgi:acyl-CoA reductase-like NAD-dependent aldehyde dehydrogenase